MAEAEAWEGRAFPSWNMSSKLFPHPGEVTVSAADPPENLLLREQRSGLGCQQKTQVPLATSPPTRAKLPLEILG